MNATIEHDSAVDGTYDPRADSIVEQHVDRIFSYQELARLDEALTMSSRETGLRFTLYIGDLGTPSRVRAEELHARSGGNPAEAVLIAVSPGQRVVEVVTGAAASRRLPDRACALAVLSMTGSFAGGDLVGGIVNGLRQLSDQAGHPSGHRRH
jgi:hypothetical protein